MEREDISLNSVNLKPNVYFFILDQYNRNDVLHNYYNYNNDTFTSKLINKEFYIVNNSLANYFLTETAA